MLEQLERFNQMSLFEKTALMQRLAVFPALTVIAWSRKDVGYRLLNPLWLTGAVLAMLAVAAFCKPATLPVILAGYAGFVLLAGCSQRFKRWREFRRGVRQHSFYLGSSPFDYRWLPGFCRRNRRIARLVEPLFWIGFGLLLFPHLPAFGGWFVFSAICLAVVEAAVQEQEVKRQMDMVDGLVTSEIQAGTVEQFTEPAGSSPATQAASEGIATGLSPELKELMKRRSRRTTPPK